MAALLPSSAPSGCRRCAESTVAAVAPNPAVCENCAADEEDLTSVWPTGDATAASPQLWCPECLSRYPNEPAEEPDGGA